jgi:aspartyl/asparaginyl beta-hydroxylase (cupin superfamily)
MIIHIIILIIILIIFYFYQNNKKLDKRYYTVDETYPFLNNIYKNLDVYKDEINSLKKDPKWVDWVEKDLYKVKSDGDWKIFPFCGFGIWVESNCQRCPKLYKFLKSIPNLKIAILSKMTPGTNLTEHQGWAHHSNYVLRCHFGFDIPDNCFLSVGDLKKDNKGEKIVREVKKYKQDEWIIFDDSKLHYSWNNGDKERLVLILDIERPKNVEKGKALVGETKELADLIKSFKNFN